MFLIKVTKNRLLNLLGNDFKFMAFTMGPATVNVLHNEGDFDLLTVNKEAHSFALESDTVAGGAAVYYAQDDQGDLLISSHVKFLEKYGFPLEENGDAIPEYLAFGMVAPPRTLFKGIQILGFGERLEVSHDAQGVKVACTKTLNVEQPEENNDPANIQAILDSIKNTIGVYSDQADRVTTLCSGGTDSSLVAKLVKETLHCDRTYSADFPSEFGQETGEAQYAQSAAEALGLNHTIIRMPKDEYFADLVDSIESAEMPVAHLQSVLLFDLFKKRLPRTCQFVFCGQGADSIGGSQETTTSYEVSKTVPYMKFVPLNSALRGVFLEAYQTFNKGYNPANYLLHCTYSLTDIDSPFWFHGMHGNLEWVKGRFGLTHEEILASKIEAMRPYEGLPAIQFAKVYGLLNDMFMTQVIWRKLAEAHGMKLIAPFAHKEIIRLSSKISYDTIFKSRKNLIRELGRLAQVPEFIFDRPKKAFGFAVEQWGGPTGFLKKLIKLTANGPYQEIYNNGLNESTKKDTMTLWYLLNYYIWRSLFIEKRSRREIFKERVGV